MRRFKQYILGTMFICSLFYSTAFAVDTLEPFEPGFSDFEMYLGYSGIGEDCEEREFIAELWFGAGLTDWLSGFFWIDTSSNGSLCEGTGSVGFGFYATPIDSEHFDTEIGLSIGNGGIGKGGTGPAGHSNAEITVTPFFELNVDSNNDMNGFGFFLVYELNLEGVDESYLDENECEVRKYDVISTSTITAGGYWMVKGKHQLFLAYGMAFHHHHDEGQDNFENGGFIFGYNVEIVENLELINELYLDIPQDDQDLTTAIYIGCLATLS